MKKSLSDRLSRFVVLASFALVLGGVRSGAAATVPKVTICHFPPGAPANVQVITVAASAVPAHVTNHNDAVCPAGDRNCCFGGSHPSVCTNFATDVNNCGACGNVCNLPNATPACTSGACTISSCNPGFGNCDGNAGNGCETPLNTTANCGACGNTCAVGASCTAGTCTCPPGDVVCSGACTNTNTDNDNCGGCGKMCAAGDTCTGGSCVTPSVCGDGVVKETTEQCDPPGSPSCPGGLACKPDCTCPPANVPQVQADPTKFLVGVATNVRVQAQILPDPGLDPNSVQLFKADDNLTPIGGALCSLKDNGDLANGDDIAGDSVFSCFAPFLEVAPVTIRLIVRVSVGGQVISSAPFFLNVVNPLTTADAQLIVTVQEQAFQIWQSKLAQFGDTVEARIEAADAIKGLQGVADAGLSTDGFTIWIAHTSGVSGGLMLNPAGTRGGSGAVPVGFRTSRRPAVPEPGPAPASFSRPRSVVSGPSVLPQQMDPALSVAAVQQAGGNTAVGNANVLVWDAYNSQFAPFDEGPGLRDLFRNSPCPKFNVTYLVDSQATVASVASFSQFGTIILVTHGAVDGSGNVVFLTREPATLLSIIVHGIDLILGRLTILNNGSQDVFSIQPSFVSNLSGTLQDSLVYNGSCQSSANNTMANAFVGKGAKTYYGYTRVVNSDYAQSAATQLFTNLVTNQKNTGDAFSPVTPKVDPKPPNATFTQSGDAKVAYSGELMNGNFETGDLTSWTQVGDGRGIATLGGFSPTEGQFMGIISTGLGFTTDSGSIEQNFCLPTTATQLKFDWNDSSEEYIEWCGPQWPFDDPFQVELVTETGTNLLFNQTIDTLCGTVTPTTLFFDQSGPGCVPTPGVGLGTGGNDCTVWSTGWRSQTIDISAIAAANNGKGVTLRFKNFDAGDSIFDSAVLLDQIEIVKP